MPARERIAPAAVPTGNDESLPLTHPFHAAHHAFHVHQMAVYRLPVRQRDVVLDRDTGAIPLCREVRPLPACRAVASCAGCCDALATRHYLFHGQRFGGLPRRSHCCSGLHDRATGRDSIAGAVEFAPVLILVPTPKCVGAE
jgi:hypothetical protein